MVTIKRMQKQAKAQIGQPRQKGSLYAAASLGTGDGADKKQPNEKDPCK